MGDVNAATMEKANSLEGKLDFSISSLQERETARRDGELDTINDVIPGGYIASEGQIVFTISTLGDEEEQGTMKRDGELGQVHDAVSDKLAASHGHVGSGTTTLEGPNLLKRDDPLKEVNDAVGEHLIASEGELTFRISTLEEP
jgi:hypothetical protein